MKVQMALKLREIQAALNFVLRSLLNSASGRGSFWTGASLCQQDPSAAPALESCLLQ